jgi:hypothetical protein
MKLEGNGKIIVEGRGREWKSMKEREKKELDRKPIGCLRK